jgi:hypothetical protein
MSRMKYRQACNKRIIFLKTLILNFFLFFRKDPKYRKIIFFFFKIEISNFFFYKIKGKILINAIKTEQFSDDIYGLGLIMHFLCCGNGPITKIKILDDDDEIEEWEHLTIEGRQHFFFLKQLKNE